VVRQTLREPSVLLLMTALFPKAVLFAREIERDAIDHVHAHFAWIEGIAAGVAKDLTGITFTIHPHAFGLFGRNQRDVRRELESASRVVTISEYNRSYIADLSPRIAPDDVEVVRCGIEPDRIQPPERPAGRSPLRILSVGRAVEKKGHEYLIGACHLMDAAGTDFRCDIIAGDGQERDALQAQIDRLGIGSTVRLLGAHDEDGVLERLQQADIFALACVVAASGDRDGIPVSLMEAMASELPVVSTAVAGIPELVEDGVSGLLVPERDSAALADALERLIADESLRRRLGRRGREKVLADFQVSEGAARMAEIFRSVSRERVG
jgi:glycosyltransferase involved in cell wall biosynthesis